MELIFLIFQYNSKKMHYNASFFTKELVVARENGSPPGGASIAPPQYVTYQVVWTTMYHGPQTFE